MSDYAPYPLTEAGFGLVSTAVTSELGTTVMRHLAQPTSTRATVFLHGAAGSWTTWTPVLTAAQRDGPPLPDPVLFDLPGWGAGSLSDDRPSIETICDLVEEAATRLGYTEWDVVGHSMGGFIALHLAATRPQTVRSVVAVSGTTWSVIESVGHPVGRFSTLPGFVSLWQVMRLLAALGRFGRTLVRGLEAARLLRPAVLPLFRHPWRIDASVIDALSREIRPRSFVAAAEIARGYDPQVWSTIRCPVAALKGDRDVFVRDDDLEKLCALLPGTRTSVVADCGHFANIERPDVVLAAIRRIDQPG